MLKFTAFLVGVAAAHIVAQAQVYRCDVGGRTTYQSMPCDATASAGRTVNVTPANTARSVPPVSAPMPSASVPAPAPARSPDPAIPAGPPPKSGLQRMAEQCLEWYRPMLRDPAGAYYRDAEYSGTVLSITVYGTNGFGGYVSKPAACEIKGGTLDEGWTKIHAKRRGWIG